MKIQKNKNKTLLSFFMIVILSVSVIMTAMPAVTAHTPPWTVKTYAYIEVTPSPIGVGQAAFVVFWLDWVPPGAGGSGGDRWRNLTVKVTGPDGGTQTLGPYISDDIGGGYASYTPQQVGTYTFTFNFPGQVVSMYGPTGQISVNPTYWDFVNDTYLPSSATTTLTVQQNPVVSPPNYPLPTGYWARPIEGQNTAWSSIASNYLYPFGAAYTFGSQRFQPDGIAPDSSHVMWTKPLQFGGIVGGDNTAIPSIAFYTGLSYESRFSRPIIIYGRLYYAQPLGNNAVGNGYVCVDLRTGQTLWTQNYTVNPSFGQLYDYESPNQHGVIPNGYLWATTTVSGVTTWMAYDAMTGLWLFNMTNVPSGTMYYDTDGSIDIYQLDAVHGWLAMWNSSADQNGPLVSISGTTTNSWQYRPIGKNANMSNAYTWNVTLPSTVPTNSVVRGVFPNDMVLLSTPTTPTGIGWGSMDYTVAAISLRPGSRGQLLWSKLYPAPAGNVTRQWGPSDPTARVFTLNDKETMQIVGYSMDNGNLLWGPVGDTRDYNYYPTVGMGSSGPAEFIAYGNIYIGGYGGEEFCYSVRNGSLLWKYNNTFSGTDTPWGNYPIFPAAIADGKIYLYSGEHSPNSPEYKGSMVRCVNATTGKEIWTLDGWAGVGGFADEGWPVADDSLVYLNTYDMQVYCLSKGPTQTTVDAPMTVIPQGQSVVIRGTVTDVSAGTKQTTQVSMFPNGVPAVSDASMSGWMQYVYMQKPMPMNAIGVPVTLTAFDPNNNTENIGTVTSDSSGQYGLIWTPPVPGYYRITATFAGSNSYYGSSAETSMGVSQAVAAAVPASPAVSPTAPPVITASPTVVPTITIAPTPSPVVIPPASSASTTTYIAIGAVVAIVVAVAAALILRRRK